ncbi:DgyrCDS8464 [Dimorphilus gyrociliatus]|uniref:Metalloendopeptidase n=1 Tax=Dimorphilus gyrociliatus TaxID=2664684 RepID=A0A7I8VU75_9ANNE|nr:DgyrCDS8464 [Dimorphilus gyrociliatus]
MAIYLLFLFCLPLICTFPSRDVISDLDKDYIKNQLQCNGLSCDLWKNLKSVLKTKRDKSQSFVHDDLVTDYNEEYGDILLTNEQAKQFIDEIERPLSDNRRKRRKVENFEKSADKKWKLPIQYRYEGYVSYEKDVIEMAIQQWENETCVRFQQMKKDSNRKVPHLIFANFGFGCRASVGRRGEDADIIYLPIANKCLSLLGVPIHEIGHALGLWHEHQRYDRDKYVTIKTDHVDPGNLINFRKRSPNYMNTYGIPYDFNSVMHYSSRGSSINNKYTIKTHDKNYQGNIGQRVHLSFLDALAINKAYCNNICQNIPSPVCANGGYQDPNSCYRCKCPHGLTGKECTMGLGTERCGGTIHLSNYGQRIIQSPNYKTGKNYSLDEDCSWLITAPKNRKILLVFEGEFGIYCESPTCYHWVEVQHKRDFRLNGYRFCCGTRPKEHMLSETNKMLISFASKHPVQPKADEIWKGFRVKVSSVPKTYVRRESTTSLSTSTEKTTKEELTTSRFSSVRPIFSSKIPFPTKRIKPSTMDLSTSTEETSTVSQLYLTSSFPSKKISSKISTLKALVTVENKSTAEPENSTKKQVSTSRNSISSKPTQIDETSIYTPFFITWGEWDNECGKKKGCYCGGCAVRTRYRICDGKLCSSLPYPPPGILLSETGSCLNSCSESDFIEFSFFGKVIRSKHIGGLQKNVNEEEAIDKDRLPHPAKQNLPIGRVPDPLMKNDVEEIRKIESQFFGVPLEILKRYYYEGDDTIDGDIKLTREQAKFVLNELKKTRHKRKALKLGHEAKLWKLPIKYYVSKKITGNEKHTVNLKTAFKHWENETCLRFKEVKEYEKHDEFLNLEFSNGCSSYVGNIYGNSQEGQYLSLSEPCLNDWPRLAHEIGHAVGFWHEHQRNDRDDYVEIRQKNFYPDESLFYQIILKKDTDDLVPYDYASLMHYGAYVGGKHKKTIAPHNPIFDKTIGQLVGLSFLDSKLINEVYCKNSCGNKKLDCKYGGYPDPNDCSKCRCPDGLGGQQCEDVAKSIGGNCSEDILLDMWQTKELISPNYGDSMYSSFLECNWRISGPKNADIVAEFVNDFQIFIYLNTICYHWVEIKYLPDKSLTGPRFCGFNRPKSVIRSKKTDIIVTFRSKVKLPQKYKGFKLVLKAVPKDYVFTTAATTISETTEATTSVPLTTKKVEYLPIPPPLEIEEINFEKCQAADILYLLDSTKSSNVGQLQRTLITVNRPLNLQEDAIRLGVISFGDEATTNIDFGDYSSYIYFAKAIKSKVKPKKSLGCNVADAFRKARKLYEDNQLGMLRHKIALMFIDGPSSVENDQTILEANKLKELGVKVVIVSISRYVRWKELGPLISEPYGDNTIWLRNFKTLNEKSVISWIQSKICHRNPDVLISTTKETTLGISTTASVKTDPPTESFTSKITNRETSLKQSTADSVTSNIVTEFSTPLMTSTKEDPEQSTMTMNLSTLIKETTSKTPAAVTERIDTTYWTLLPLATTNKKNKITTKKSTEKSFTTYFTQNSHSKTDSSQTTSLYKDESTVDTTISTKFPTTLTTSLFNMSSPSTETPSMSTESSSSSSSASQTNTYRETTEIQHETSSTKFSVSVGKNDITTNELSVEETQSNPSTFKDLKSTLAPSTTDTSKISTAFDSKSETTENTSKQTTYQITTIPSLSTQSDSVFFESTTESQTSTLQTTKGDLIVFSCSFETESGQKTLCNMIQSDEDKFDWTIHSGETKSSKTGPREADSLPFYLYIEATNKNNRDYALISTPALSSGGQHCLEFMYNMYGFHIGKLSIFKESANKLEEVWALSKQQTTSTIWRKATVSISLDYNDKITFGAWRAKGYSGDIAIDTIKLTKTADCIESR